MNLQGKFIISAQKLSQCPSFGNMPEYALLGRSNVGKSSFINRLANNFKLAKTSNTPGKTRLINFFNFSEKFIVADLPGYGYASVNTEMRNEWDTYLSEYLLNRESLTACVQFIDARHAVQKNDIEMRKWLNQNNLPIFTIATKVDYLPRTKLPSKLAEFRKTFNDEVYPFSSKNNDYVNKILEILLAKNINNIT